MWMLVKCKLVLLIEKQLDIPTISHYWSQFLSFGGPENRHQIQDSHGCAERVPTTLRSSLNLSTLVFPECTARAKNVNLDVELRTPAPYGTSARVKSSLTSRLAGVAIPHVFNHEVKFKTGPVTSQKSGGRCWLFATTNDIRHEVMKQLKLKEFQLSQSYLFFWDKLNKSNYYFELSIQNAELPIDDRLVNFLADDLISNGGQLEMVVNLLETYGLVRQPIYAESFHSSASSPINVVLKMKLREHALTLRTLSSSLKANPSVSQELAISTLRAKKEELMQEVYTIMSATLGVPPKPDAPFTLEYYTEDGKYAKWERSTPLQFYKAFTAKYSPAEFFSLINDPRNEYGKLYTADKLGNIWGGRPVLYVNTQIDDLKQAVSIKAGQPVFFGCDVGQFSNSGKGVGIMDTNYLEYEVENSWGEDSGVQGFNVMSEKWFDQFVFQVKRLIGALPAYFLQLPWAPAAWMVSRQSMMKMKKFMEDDEAFRQWTSECLAPRSSWLLFFKSRQELFEGWIGKTWIGFDLQHQHLYPLWDSAF
ncbi:peptidase C1-like family-domain-containing protein [Suillus cothurnatus]|nr:peptidase C1-like family-domain-containing protein [Suillus cothurnatus]